MWSNNSGCLIILGGLIIVEVIIVGGLIIEGVSDMYMLVIRRILIFRGLTHLPKSY